MLDATKVGRSRSCNVLSSRVQVVNGVMIAVSSTVPSQGLITMYAGLYWKL